MSTKKVQLDHYRKALLNRVTSSNAITQYIENCLAREDEAAKHSFHKVMIHNWSGTSSQLFDTLSEYFSSTLIPVMYVSKIDITSFYTSSLSLILKMIKLDFMFPFERNMFNIDVLFNDKNSVDCFDNPVSVEDIVSGVVSRRINEHFELDLSNFCCDPEFVEKKICFYKITLLSHFKILMLRMGRDTKMLNLSNNELSQVPVDILNFFIKSLTAIDLSHNNIPSISEVLRVSSRIEKLWIEGNPLCEEMDPVDYVKSVTMKFPRLIELDGVPLIQNGLPLPFFRNYIVQSGTFDQAPDRRTRMVVEKFLTLYFSNYDWKRKKVFTFYDDHPTFTVVSSLSEEHSKLMPEYAKVSRNLLEYQKHFNPKKPPIDRVNYYNNKASVIKALNFMPATIHDPTTFTVDVMWHDRSAMVLVVDGIFKDVNRTFHLPDHIFQFRRTFVFKIVTNRQFSNYLIQNDILSLSAATEEQVKNSFKTPIKNLNELALMDPDPEDTEAIIKAFVYITQLKRHEAETRLKFQDFDIRKALSLFINEMKHDKVSKDKFIEDDDFSDRSSLMDDEID